MPPPAAIVAIVRELPQLSATMNGRFNRMNHLQSTRTGHVGDTTIVGTDPATRLDKVIVVLEHVVAEVASIEDDLTQGAPRLDREQSTRAQQAAVILRMAQDATTEAVHSWYHGAMRYLNPGDHSEPPRPNRPPRDQPASIQPGGQASRSITAPALTELIVRAVVRVDEMLLVAHAHGTDSVFLPGGHVEPGEPIEQALRRELVEELGVDADIGALLGFVEHTYTDNDAVARHEVNFVFDVTVPDAPLTSHEAHIEFVWISTANLDGAELLPAAVKRVVRMPAATGPVWLPWRPR